jgi:glutamyl-tRNA reductase
MLSGLGPEQQDAVDAMTRAIVKKILHQPLSQVRAWAESGELEHLESVFAAFGEVADEDV